MHLVFISGSTCTKFSFHLRIIKGGEIRVKATYVPNNLLDLKFRRSRKSGEPPPHFSGSATVEEVQAG